MPDALLTMKPGVIDMITVPPITYLAIDGQGAPSGPVYGAAVSALYTLAYAARFAGKARGVDQKVGPLEGLWWAEDMADSLTGARERWLWRMLIRAPDWLDSAALDELRATAARKHAGRAADLARVSVWHYDEGPCLQALHLGPSSEEAPLIARMPAEAEARGLSLGGHHHEFYLNDPSRTAPERLRTILRQPVRASPA